MRLLLPLLLTSLLLFSCQVSQKECPLCTGDLIFVRDTTGMGEAIAASTGEYTHVAIAQCTDSGLYVYEALPRRGVIHRPFSVFCHDYNDSLQRYADCYRLQHPFDTAYLQQHLQRSVGLPYDDAFLPANGRLYCSELVYEAFRDTLSHPVFQLKPMNFLAPDSTLPAYWQHHFDSLGTSVPQDLPGTNPTDLSQEPFLQKIQLTP